MALEDSTSVPVSNRAAFATTHWSVVLAAGDSQSPNRTQALERLCQEYWYPLYAYTRRRGHSPEDAQDLTQGFFERFLGGNSLNTVGREKGRFRSYLLGAMNHYLSDQWDRARRQKRGGAHPTIALDLIAAEERYRSEPDEAMNPERIYERRWALTLLEQVLQQLEAEFRALEKGVEFDTLKIFLLGEKGEVSYADAATRLGVRESAVGVAIHRMRRRYGELFREAIANTVASPAEVEDEVNHLLRTLRGV